MPGLGAAQRRFPLHAFIQMDLRFRLVAHKVVGNPDKRLGAREPSRVADQPRNLLGLKRHRQQVPILTGPPMEHVEPCQQPELVGQVIETSSDFKTTPERALGLLAVALGEHEGMTQRGLKLKLPRGSASPVIEGRERATAPDTTLVQQIEFDKQSGASACQRHAEVRAIIIGIDPGQRGPGIGEQTCTLLRTRRLTASARFRHGCLK